MKQGWFKRNFGWIADDFHRMVAQLRKPDTWILIGLVLFFGIIGYYAFQLALRMDFMMRLRHMTSSACREIGNSTTAILFFGTFFFGLTLVMVFGEFARYQDYKERRVLAYARSAALQCAGWGAFALTIGVAIMLLLESQCI